MYVAIIKPPHSACKQDHADRGAHTSASVTCVVSTLDVFLGQCFDLGVTQSTV